MKRIKVLKNLAFLLTALIILTQLFTLSPLADISAGTEWSISDDEQNLTNESEGITYTYFWSEVALRPDSKYVYVYDQAIWYMDESYFYISGNLGNPNAVWIEIADGYHIFVTSTAKADLISFTEGKSGNYFIANDDGERAEISKNVIAKLSENYKNRVDTESFDVRYLKSNKVCDIIVQDESKTFAYTKGAIFSQNGDWWYVDYTALDVSYFDANGNFSYYHGRPVNMTKVDQETASVISERKNNMQPYEVFYDYEIVISDGSLNGDSDFLYSSLVSIFWVVYFALIVLPAVVLVPVGCILPFMKKLGRPRYWFIVAGLAALWLILALSHWILLAFPIFS